ncbi:MAG TPA: aromatic ring-hydroxylating dioxygenase subunit alpha [Rhizomicrobium sp.]|nr:aromatic ring-hydroxylating dioxygenase subunit alpha [Rhizomicrobium sp.]
MAGDAEPLRGLWYMPALASSLKRGQMRREMLLGEPVLLGRMRDGEVFAMRDICPHRGVPLSAGKILSENTVECPYHGWRFRHDGVCSAIPSLVEGQDLDPQKIRVRHYPVREQDGLIWVYVAAKNEAPNIEPPRVPAVGPGGIGANNNGAHPRPGRAANQKIRWHEAQIFSCDIDHAVIGLMDPAHAGYVHDHWWWYRTPRVKEKHYAPLPMGFVMTAHKPSKAAYNFFGDVTTEITFELPSTRFETIKGKLLGREFTVVGLTVCTPRDDTTTSVIQVFYWPGWLFFIRPFFMLLGPTFIADDRKIVELQREGLKFNPTLMLIQDSDQPAIWYHRVKKAWAESLESGREFVNPIRERTLRWRS